MLTLETSLAGLAVALVALVALIALVYAMLVFSADERFEVWYFIGMLVMFGVGLGAVALMSLVSPRTHDLIIIGISVGSAVVWVLLYLGLGKKTLIVGFIAVVGICSYAGYSAALLALGRSPLAQVPKTVENSTPQVEVTPPPPVFQDKAGSMTSNPRPTEAEKTPSELPQPTPQPTQTPPAPEQRQERTNRSPEPSAQPTVRARRPERTTVAAPPPSPEPSTLPTARPRQEPTTVTSPPPVTSNRREVPASPSTAASPEVVVPPTDQGSPPSPAAVVVPKNCYIRSHGSLDCMLNSQEQTQ